MALISYRSALLAAAFALSAVPATADLFVDPNLGSDTLGVGTSASPFRSITHALAVVSSPDTINLAPGVYSGSTGEAYPLIVPRGVNIVDASLSQAAWIRGLSNFPNPVSSVVIQIDHSSGPAGLGNKFSGFGVQGGSWAVSYVNASTDVPVKIEMNHLFVKGTAMGAVKVDVTRQTNLQVECTDVQLRTGDNGYGHSVQPVDAIRITATSSQLDVALTNCDLVGLSTGVQLKSKTGTLSSAINVAMNGVILHGHSKAGLVSIAEPLSTIHTAQNHCVYYHIGHWLNAWHAAIVDDQDRSGITHEIRQTIFNLNNSDFQDYDALRYTLSGNVYHKQHVNDPPLTGTIPGGINSAVPGFVQPGFDFHLRDGAEARDRTPALLPDYVGGDLDGEFDSVMSTGCFDGMLDAGADEYRAFTLVADKALVQGETKTWSGIGPKQVAGQLPWKMLLFAGAPGTETACPKGLELEPLSPIYFVNAVDLDAAGLGEIQISVPVDPALAGLEVTAQAVFVDLNTLATGFSHMVRRAITG